MLRIFNSIFISISLFAILCCHDKEDPCNCQSNETCVHDTYTGITDCFEKGTYYHLGGQLFHARNLYVGIINNNLCIDTLIFLKDTLRALDHNRFALLANVFPWGIFSLMEGYPPFQAGENEFYSSTNDRICFLNGEDWHANLHFKVYPDSVWMKLGFWTFNSEPGVLIDSATVIFHKPD
jgi:hypothetical protein